MTNIEDNKALVRRITTHGVNKHDVEFLKSVLAEDYLRHSQATTEMPELHGRDQMLQFFQAAFAAFPDWHEEIELLIAEEDKVALITKGTGTQTGPWGDMQPSGKKVSIDNFVVHRIEDGLIAETWIGWDNLAMLTQLGLFPAQTS